MANIIYFLKLLYRKVSFETKQTEKPIERITQWKIEYGSKKIRLTDEELKEMFEHIQDEGKEENLLGIYFKRNGFGEGE